MTYLDKGEVIVAVDPQTGGEKEVNAVRMDLIPPLALWELGRVFGLGAAKYSDNNWRKGYKWSNSAAALQRHFARWMDGEDRDEGGFLHLAAVMWHAAVLIVFSKEHPELDDRYKRVPTECGCGNRLPCACTCPVCDPMNAGGSV